MRVADMVVAADVDVDVDVFFSSILKKLTENSGWKK